MSHASYVTYLLRVKCDGLHAPHVSDIELTNHRVACHMCYKHYMSHMLHMLHVTCSVTIMCCQGGLYDMTHFTGHPGGVGRLQMAAGNDLEVCRGGSWSPENLLIISWCCRCTGGSTPSTTGDTSPSTCGGQSCHCISMNKIVCPSVCLSCGGQSSCHCISINKRVCPSVCHAEVSPCHCISINKSVCLSVMRRSVHVTASVQIKECVRPLLHFVNYSIKWMERRLVSAVYHLKTQMMRDEGSSQS